MLLQTVQGDISCALRQLRKSRGVAFADPATLVALGHVADGTDSNGAPNVSASQVITLFPRHSRIRQPRRLRADRL